MILTELEIRRLPGIETPFRIEPAETAATVITGPNASGKSSLGRALKALLYPAERDGFCELSATFRAESRAWEVQRQGGQVEWRCSGKPAAAPPLPAAENLGAFLIHSDDLGPDGDTEARIAAQLQMLLAGGYDLAKIAESAPLKSPPRPHRISRELGEARNRARKLELAYAELAGKLDRIDDLQQAHSEAVTAQSRLDACNRALEYCRTDREWTAAKLALKRYPETMAGLRGDEPERLDRLEQSAAEKRIAADTARRELESAQAAFAATGIEDPAAMEIFRADLGDLRQQLKEVEDRRDELAHLAADQELALADARRRAGGQVDKPPAHLEPATLDQLDRLVDSVRDLRQREAAAQRELDQLEAEGADGRRIDRLQQACQSLRRWLRQPEPTRPEISLWAVLSALGLVSSLSGLTAGFRPDVVVLMLLATLVPAWRLIALILRGQRARLARELYPDSGVEPPVGWTWDEVESRLEDLEEELARTRQAFVTSARYTALKIELNQLGPEREKAEAELNEVAARLGLVSELRLSSGFLIWCRALLDWQQATRRLAETGAAQEAAMEDLKQLHLRIAALFRKHGQALPEALDWGVLGRYLNQLTPTLQQAHAAANAMDRCRRRIEELKADLAELETRRIQLFGDAGLDRPDRDELRIRLGQLASYRELVERENRLRLKLDTLRQELEPFSDLLEMAVNADSAGLETSLEALSRVASRRDEIQGEMSALETRHAELVERRELEALNLAQERLRLELEEALDNQLLAGAGQFLIRRARQTHRSRHQPRVLARAADWFGRFTRYQYALDFDQARFSAIDTATNRHRSLTELSTGTRVQLLLAVRLAWLEEAERGRENLPLVLDEVLSTSDPDRYRSVVEALQELIRDGRQVIYLSAQDADAQAWSRFAGKPRPKHIRLDRVRRGRIPAGQEALEFTLPERRAWPDPKKASPERWAREARIGPIDPWRDVGRLDLFFLLRDDLELLVKLKTAGIENLGQLEGWLAHSGDGVALNPATRDELERRARAARAWVRNWRRGRSRPVTGSVLAESDTISQTFLAPVTELADQLDGDPEALLKALRDRQVPRFRQRSADLLEVWLADRGYLDGRTPVAGGEIVAEIASESGLDRKRSAELARWLESGLAPGH